MIARKFDIDIDEECVLHIQIESETEALTKSQLREVASELRELAETIAVMDGPER